MRIVLFLSSISLLSGAAVAQDAPSKAAAAADRFSVDIPSVDPAPRPADAPAEPAVTPAPAAATFSLDTPIAALLVDYRAKAVLDKNLPGLSSDENLDKFKGMSLRQFAPLTGGQLTPELMASTAYDLAAITAGSAPSAPARRKSMGR